MDATGVPGPPNTHVFKSKFELEWGTSIDHDPEKRKRGKVVSVLKSRRKAREAGALKAY